ncbi:Rod shape-determining protein MreC [Candidatus Sulfotelmatobacter sp. SbA7]|jgi:rod shape-determining protein MreC|nr:Rod shape-determining protein MreC [Candidatus Sulfotelmatobacter sp. SbA7]
MESVLGRYRNLTILVGILFLQVLGLAVQVKRSSENESTRLIRIWAVNTITPFEKGIVWAQHSSSNLWHNYFYLRGVRQENRDLKQKIQQMEIERARLSEDANQARRLQALLGFKEQFIAQTVAAQVIGSSGSEQSRSVYIDKGSNAGLKSDMAVITGDGVVGKTLLVSRSVSQVLLIDDQTSGVGAILEKSRLQGILRGTPAGEIVLEKVMSDEPVQPGEKVLTSGGDRIFPKGLPVGTVTRVSPGSELFLNIRVKPAADLSRLEEVLVITQQEEEEPVASETEPLRAADILAERLPAVPAKPAADVSKQATGTPAATTGAKPAPGASISPQVTKPAEGNVPKVVNTAAPKPNTPATGTSQKAAAAPGKTSRNSANAAADNPPSTTPQSQPQPPASQAPPAQDTPH